MDTDRICRYCLDSSGIFISPCQCKGTQAFIHLSCQKNGYAIKNDPLCPICKVHFYNLIEEPEEYICDNLQVYNVAPYIPAVNICISMFSFITMYSMCNIKSIPVETQFVIFELIWQIGILSMLLLFVLKYHVRNVKKYLYYMFLENIFTHINLQLLIFVYLAIDINRSDIGLYQILIFASHCFMHTHIFNHIAILTRINEERQIVFLE